MNQKIISNNGKNCSHVTPVFLIMGKGKEIKYGQCRDCARKLEQQGFRILAYSGEKTMSH